ncbi:hypothetical protein F4802DRAFT_566426 [Xylaria palmicola]|nr:hypothetical protein F4802DRAFT_566426 [Xylaria palmicola]
MTGLILRILHLLTAIDPLCPLDVKSISWSLQAGLLRNYYLGFRTPQARILPCNQWAARSPTILKAHQSPMPPIK